MNTENIEIVYHIPAFAKIYTLSLHDALPIFRIFLMSRKIILIKQELLLLVYELNRSGLLAENEKIRKQAVVIPALRSEERFSRNAETELVCRLPHDKKKLARKNTMKCGHELC